LGWYAHLSSELLYQAVSDAVQEKDRAYGRCRDLFPLFDGQGVRRIVQKTEALIARRT